MNKKFTRLLGRAGLLLLSLFIFVQAMAQDGGKKISVESALNSISKKYNTRFAYEHAIIQGKTTASENLSAKNLDEVLKRVLYPNNLLFLYVSEGTYTIVTRDEKLFSPSRGDAGTAQSVAENSEVYVSGLITDENQDPLPGATIKANSSNRVVSTDASGRFSVFLPADSKEISISYLGYESQNYKLTIPSRQIKISLKPSQATQLKNVNIISNGYQTMPKERSTGAGTFISPDDIKKVPVPNIVAILESMVPGLKVTLNSNNLFTYNNTQVAINSGTHSVGASDYNMAIRGNSTLQGEKFPLVVIDGAISELDLSAMNPNDISGISFLKDAAAASIWGTRAANGVIVITTKRGGENQAPKINFSVTASVSNRPDLNYLKTMSSAQTIEYEQELVNKNLITAPSASTPFGQPLASVTDLTFKLKAGTITQAAYDAAIAKYAGINSKDQISDYILRPASNQQYNLSVSGGGKNTDYFYSTSYSRENPYTVGTNGSRLTFTLNNNFKLFKVATLSTSLRGSFFKYNNNGLSLNSFFNPSPTTFMPYNQMVDEQGKRVSYSRRYYSDWVSSLYSKGYLNWAYNPLDEMDNSDYVQKDNNYTYNLNLNVPIFKGLSANAFYSNERAFSSSRQYSNENTFTYRDLVNSYTPIPVTGQAVNSIGLSPGSGLLSTVNTTGNNYTLRGQLNYDNTLGKDHQLTMIIGSEIRQTQVGQGGNTMYGYNTGTGISRPVNYFTPYATILGYNSSLGGSPNQQDKTRRYLSYYSNAAYTYKGKYTLSGSVRYDDYNNFGVDRKFRATPLYSFGGKWDAFKESFLKNEEWISNLSIRATYGVNGNISTTIYPFTYIGLSPADYTTGLPSASIISPANPELRWEKTYVSNLGVDFAFMNNRLSGTFDIYRKHGKDLFYPFPVNGTYGVTTLTRNSTELIGRGLDISLTGSVVRKTDYEWSLGGNFAYNTNKVLDARFIPASSFYASPAYSQNLNGYPTDKLLVYKNAGLDASGLTQIYDEKGNKLAANQNITSLDALTNAGRTIAPYFGSINTSFRYKKITLLAIATYQFGSVFLKPTISAYSTARTGLKYDLSEDIAQRWRKAGDEAFTNVPGAAGTYAATSLLRYQQSDINVLKGDYVRLRELSLTYQLPVEHITRAVKAASFGFSVRNLGLLWTANKEGIDPDFPSSLSATTLSLPAPVSYNFTLNVNF